MSLLIPKQNRIRDKKWLDHVKTMPCVLSGLVGDEYRGVDPHHLMAGRGSLSMKASDDLVLPLAHQLHEIIGTTRYPTEQALFRDLISDDLLMRALKAYAREIYREWKGC